MLFHYLKIAFRNLAKNRIFSAINIIGLTTGLGACILIGLFIADELSFDQFHDNRQHIVRTTMEYKRSEDIKTSVFTGTRVGPRLKSTFPWIRDYVRTVKGQLPVSYGDRRFTERNILYADQALFSVFSFPIINGDAKTPLDTYDKVVLTSFAAKKYFGSADPLGKVLQVNGKDYKVSAIAKDVPANSQIQFDLVMNFAGTEAAKTEQWWTANYITYFLLKDNGPVDMEQQVAAYMATPQVKQEARLAGSDFLQYHFEPLTSVHLYSALDGFEPNGNITYVYILGAIALLILIIACVNYTNLAIAQSATRRSEIGVRKVLGASHKQLFGQFIGESFIVTFFSLLLAVAISTQLISVLNNITGKHISTTDIFNIRTLSLILSAGMVISFFAGVYPALVLSGSSIISILKKETRVPLSGIGLRRSLIVVQFVISVFLISTTVIVLQQLNYIRSKDLGYNKDHLLIIPLSYRQSAKYDGLKQSLKKLPGVNNVSGAYGLPTSIKWSDGISSDEGTGKKELSVKAIPVDVDFISTMHMQLLAGNDFTHSDLLLMDTTDNGKNFQHSFMLNETAARELGWTPQQAIGKRIEKGSPGIVKAVVRDFHFASMHETVGPLLVFLDKSFVQNIFVNINSNDIPGVLKHIEQIWKDRVPGDEFAYRFMDDDFNSLYKTEQRTAVIFSTAAGLAILLACLGLFGLAAFTTARRTKEIGIRKVLGASVLNITSLISKEFMILVGIALLIATPVAWMAAGKWLEDFAYRIQLSWLVFVVTGAAALLIAFLTVSIQAVKAATANPVKSIRTE
jgi:putative ABC transport system permease protein